MTLRASDILPNDTGSATLVGRLWVDDHVPGPRPIIVRHGALFDLSLLAPTVSDLFELDNPARAARAHEGAALGSLDEALARGALLAPCDLQAVKACGVTFAASAIERVVEERARGDAAVSRDLRIKLGQEIGGALRDIAPGSAAAARVKQLLIEEGLWSQYLEVAIGPDPEIFTKAQPMSSVGCGAAIGLHPRSEWNNPEAEIVLAVNSRGDVVGATLGNDVNLRDFEGRSALLLGLAKDNNASCAIGPFVRLFDDAFTLRDIEREEIRLTVAGTDGFTAEGTASMSALSRPPTDLVQAAAGNIHQYPDGFMLFLGAGFVPTLDRAGNGEGFTHRLDDTVSIRSTHLGALINSITTSDKAPPWIFGTRALMRSLAARGLI